jgi:FMN phosphatase YigB (HAD superfamily)
LKSFITTIPLKRYGRLFENRNFFAFVKHLLYLGRNFSCAVFLKAWHLCDPDAEKVFEAIKKAGVKLAVVSNFDTRLRPLLRALNCDHWFDAVAVSAEVRKSCPTPPKKKKKHTHTLHDTHGDMH